MRGVIFLPYPTHGSKLSYEQSQEKMLLKSQSYHKKLDDGTTIYVFIDEDVHGNPVAVFINEGKVGSRERSYTDCMARLITRLLQAKVELKEITMVIDGITCATNDSMPCAVADIFRKHLAALENV